MEKLEKRHRYSHLFHRVRMLGLLKSEEYSTLGEAAKSLGYSRRQGQRWFAAYKEGGVEELLTSRVDERGRNELVSEEAFLELDYHDHHRVLVLDNAPSHLSKEIVHPENISLLNLPAYSPELNPVERWFQEFRRALS